MTVSEYNQCVDNYADALFRFILKNLKDNESAQDIVQESFMRLWEKAKEISNEKSKSYLFTTAYHLIVDNIHYKNRFLQIEHAENSYIEDNYQNFDIQKTLNQALNLLPEDQKVVLLLRDYEGFSYKEIEIITGLKESQVKVYIYRARIYLKKHIHKIEFLI